MKNYVVRAFNDRGDLYLTSINGEDQEEEYSFDNIKEAEKLYNQEISYLMDTHKLADEFDEKDGRYIQVVIQEEENGEFIKYVEMSETFKLN